jgi:nucleoside-diphosphate-sugar epimerase
MKLVGMLTGKSGAVNRLTGSLTVDSSKIRLELGWTPPFTMDEGLKETAKWFLATDKGGQRSGVRL